MENSTKWDNILEEDNEEEYNFKKLPGTISEETLKRIGKEKLL